MRVENREKSSPTDGADQGMRTGRALSSLKLRKNRQRVSPGHVNRRFNAVRHSASPRRPSGSSLPRPSMGAGSRCSVIACRSRSSLGDGVTRGWGGHNWSGQSRKSARALGERPTAAQSSSSASRAAKCESHQALKMARRPFSRIG